MTGKRHTSADINRPLSVTVTGGGGAVAGGGSGTLPGTLTGDTGNTVVGDRHYHKVQLAHSALLGIAADDHHDPVTVGNTGLSIAGQQVSLNLAAVSGLEVDGGLKLADSIAGAGLSIASKVLAVGAGDGISVGADTVAVRLASPAGLSFSGGALQLDDTVAGAGLAINAKVLGIDLATNSGLELSGSPAKLHLRTPSSLDATTANTVTDVLGHTHKVTTGSARGLSASTVNAEGTGAALARADHGHAITAYSDLTTYPGHLAKADASGDSTWHRIDLTDRLRAPLIDSAAGQGLTIAPDEDLSLSPASGVVKATSGVAVGTDNFVSQMTGWRADYAGGADFRYLYADELHAKSFITDLEQALAGGQIISKSVAVIAVDFTVPAAGAAGTLTVEDLPGANGQAVFQANDIVRLRQFSRGSGSLSIANCWGVVTGYSDNGDGTQSWTFTRSSGARAGTATAGSTIPARSLALDYGVSGNGFYEVNAIDGVWAQNSPYAQVVTWATHPADGQVVRSRWGNLKGIFAAADDYGLYAAVAGHTAADQYLRISSQGAALHNLPLEMYSGDDKVLALSPTAPDIALGNPIPTGWLSQNGYWAGRHTDGTYRQYVGQVSGGALIKGASWDGQSYNVVGNLIVGPGVGYVVDSALIHLPFDGPVPYETDFHVDLSGHVGQEPTTATGGIIGRPGKFGKAVQCAEATTNLVTNPSFEVDTAGWSGYIADLGTGSFARSGDMASVGSYSLYVYKTSDVGYYGVRGSLSVTSGQAYSFSVDVYILSGGLPAELRVKGQGIDIAKSTTTHGEWVRLTGSGTATSTGTCYIYLRLAPGSGETKAYFDAVQAENKAYSTPYGDGSMGTGHAWTGTAHASTSTRTETNAQYGQSVPVLAGTISAWVKEESTTGTCVVLHQGFSSSTYITLAYDGTQIVTYWGTEKVAADRTRDRDWHHLVATRVDGLVSLYRDGVLVDTSTANSPAVTLPATTPTYVGRGPSGSWLDGYLDDLLILDRALTADEVKQLYTSGRPVTVTGSPHSLLLTGPGRGKVEGHAGGIFGWDGAAQPMWGFCNEDGVSFGGATLYAGDALIGDVAGGNYIQWDASAKKLTVRGDVAVTGTVSVAWAEITNKPDGAGRLGTGTPGSSGLWLTGAYMGYFDGSSWRTRISNDGDFLFSKAGGASLLWDASEGKLQGRDASSNVQWETDATTGAIMAGTGRVSLGATGLQISGAETSENSYNRVTWFDTTHIVSKLSSGLFYSSFPDILLASNPDRYYAAARTRLEANVDATHYSKEALIATKDDCYWLVEVKRDTTQFVSVEAIASADGEGGRQVYIAADGQAMLVATKMGTAHYVSIPGGLNVGTATGAAKGEVYGRNGANVNLTWAIDSGSSGAYYAALDFRDRGTSKWGLGKDNANKFYIAESGVANRLMIVPGGRVLIGTTTDDGVNKLQVNGGYRGYGDCVVSGSFACGAAAAVFFGETDVDGRWRFVRSGNNLLAQRRESGSWVTKHTFAA